MFINDIKIYDGAILKERFAYKFFRRDTNPLGNIVAFRAPMDVKENLIDLEDSLEKDFIYSDDAVNFIWEIPNLCPFGAVAFQRLFNTHIANILTQLISEPIEMRGDDLIIPSTDRDWKASVSITYSKNNVAIGHTGININAGNRAPNFAFSTELSDEQVEAFVNAVISGFNALITDITLATTKVIV